MFFRDPPPFFQTKESESFTLQDIDLSMYFEFTEEQRFIDISRLNFRIPEMDVQSGSVSGQIYNDDRFFELNAFRVLIDDSRLHFSGEAEGVNLLQDDIPGQLAASSLQSTVSRFEIDSHLLESLFPEINEFPGSINLSFSANGNLDSLNYEELRISVGENYLSGYGYLKN